MKLAVIVPVYNGSTHLQRCLKGIVSSTRTPDQLIVVDDSSTDDSAAIARNFTNDIVSIENGPLGPANARNHGAYETMADVLIFIDSDVVVHKDTIDRIAGYFERSSDLDALFGSYDSDPPARNLTSRYKNLLHHFVHQNAQRSASTFWAGCGAIRRQAFSAIGGFDARYKDASVEDIELGMRLRKRGYQIRLYPDVQATHLKYWTFRNLLFTDIFRRAIPWSRLLVEDGKLVNDLNLSMRHRLSAIVSLVMLFTVLAALWSSTAIILFFGMVFLFIALNLKLVNFFQNKGGLLFAVGASCLHLLHLMYSSLVFLSIKALYLARSKLSWILAKNVKVL